MRNAIGDPVSGENFLNREKELRSALHLLENRNSFLLLGIRRTGKSSFLQELARRLKEQDGIIVVEMNCQGYESSMQFYRELYDALPKDLQSIFKKLLSDSSNFPTRVKTYLTDWLGSAEIGGTVKLEFRQEWVAYSNPLDNLLADFFKAHSNVVLFLDELPFFFQNLTFSGQQIQDIQRVLTSLRTWRNAGLAMGIAGSLNLHLQLESLGISRKLAAGLNSLKLEPFTRPEAKTLLDKLVASKKYDWWTSAITQKLLDLLPDHVPYFIQLAFHHVVVNRCATPEDVEDVFHNDIAPNFQTDFTYQFDERLAKFSQAELPSAQAILDHLAKEGTATFSQIQQAIADRFQYDALTKLLDYEFLTMQEEQQYCFSLNILRNWWRQKRAIR